MDNERRLKDLERRRRGARLLASGLSQAEVARRVGVSRQSVLRWERRREEGGKTPCAVSSGLVGRCGAHGPRQVSSGGLLDIACEK